MILRNPASENTWNPPESVRIGLSQTMNLCSPPNFLIISSPGRTWRLETTINRSQMLFGINQGAIFEDIRIDHAKAISELDLDGYAVGTSYILPVSVAVC